MRAENRSVPLRSVRPAEVALPSTKHNWQLQEEKLAVALARKIEVLVGVKLHRDFYPYWLITLILKFPSMVMAERCRAVEALAQADPARVRALWECKGWIDSRTYYASSDSFPKSETPLTLVG